MSTNKKPYANGTIVQLLGLVREINDEGDDYYGGYNYDIQIISAVDTKAVMSLDIVSIDHDEIVGVVSQSALDKIKNKQKNDRLKEIETQMASLKKEADKIKAEMKPKTSVKK